MTTKLDLAENFGVFTIVDSHNLSFFYTNGTNYL